MFGLIGCSEQPVDTIEQLKLNTLTTEKWELDSSNTLTDPFLKIQLSHNVDLMAYRSTIDSKISASFKVKKTCVQDPDFWKNYIEVEIDNNKIKFTEVCFEEKQHVILSPFEDVDRESFISSMFNNDSFELYGLSIPTGDELRKSYASLTKKSDYLKCKKIVKHELGKRNINAKDMNIVGYKSFSDSHDFCTAIYYVGRYGVAKVANVNLYRDTQKYKISFPN